MPGGKSSGLTHHTTGMAIDEAALVRQAQRGDRSAFETLVRATAAEVLKMLDVTQTVA